MIYLLTAIGLSPSGSSAVDIYAQTIHMTTQITTNLEECGPCPVFVSFTLAFVLQLRKKHGKNLSQVKKYQSFTVRTERDIQREIFVIPKKHYCVSKNIV
jgi:hypothetical protein